MPLEATRLSDVVVPEVFYPYIYQFTPLTSAFIKSGIFARSPEYDMMAGSIGNGSTIPMLRPYTGRALPWRADGNNTTDSIKQTSTQMSVPYLRRRIKMGWNNLASAIAGIKSVYQMGQASWGYNAAVQPGDASRILATYVTDFWNEDLQKTVIAMLNGCFASTTNVANWTELAGKAPGLADLTLDTTLSPAQVTANTPIGVVNRISPVTIGGAQSLLSDRGGNVTTMAIHPDTYWRNIQPNNITPNLQTTAQEWNAPTYLGMNLILDDTLPVDRTNPLYPKYTSYLFAPQSICFGDNQLDPGHGAELDRNVDQAEDFLTTRRKYLVQMNGMSYSGPFGGAAGEGPSDVDFATAANWQRADDIKNMGVVRLISNA